MSPILSPHKLKFSMAFHSAHSSPLSVRTCRNLIVSSCGAIAICPFVSIVRKIISLSHFVICWNSVYSPKCDFHIIFKRLLNLNRNSFLIQLLSAGLVWTWPIPRGEIILVRKKKEKKTLSWVCYWPIYQVSKDLNKNFCFSSDSGSDCVGKVVQVTLDRRHEHVISSKKWMTDYTSHFLIMMRMMIIDHNDCIHALNIL